MRALSALRREPRSDSGGPAGHAGTGYRLASTDRALQSAMPPGAARNALDCALFDLEAKTARQRVWDLLGRPAPKATITAYTISLASPEVMAAASAKASQRPAAEDQARRRRRSASGSPQYEGRLRIANSLSMQMRRGARPTSSKISRDCAQAGVTFGGAAASRRSGRCPCQYPQAHRGLRRRKRS